MIIYQCCSSCCIFIQLVKNQLCYVMHLVIMHLTKRCAKLLKSAVITLFPVLFHITVFDCCYDSGKELLSQKDLAQLSSNHENFSRMSNTLEVILRLYSRGAISQNLREQLIHKYNDKGQSYANSKILNSM